MPDADDDLPELVRQLTVELGIIAQLMETEARLSLAPDLSVSEYGVLNHFVRRGRPEEPGQLARAFQQAKSSMTATLGKLARKGYITIDPDPEDGRKKLAMITETGREAWQRGTDATAAIRRAIGEEMGRERLRSLLPHLTRLRMFLDEARNERDGFS